MFTCKGSQNHMISDMWKASVKREQRAARRWAKKYLSEQQQQQQLAEAMTVASTAVPVEEQQPVETIRLPHLRAVYSTTNKLMLSSVSFRPSSKELHDLDLSLRFPNCGHKPIVATSFYRTNGVFGSVH